MNLTKYLQQDERVRGVLGVDGTLNTCALWCRILHPCPTSDTGVLRPAATVLGVDGGRTPLRICLAPSAMMITRQVLKLETPKLTQVGLVV